MLNEAYKKIIILLEVKTISVDIDNWWSESIQWASRVLHNVNFNKHLSNQTNLHIERCWDWLLHNWKDSEVSTKEPIRNVTNLINTRSYFNTEFIFPILPAYNRIFWIPQKNVSYFHSADQDGWIPLHMERRGRLLQKKNKTIIPTSIFLHRNSIKNQGTRLN